MAITCNKTTKFVLVGLILLIGCGVALSLVLTNSNDKDENKTTTATTTTATTTTAVTPSSTTTTASSTVEDVAPTLPSLPSTSPEDTGEKQRRLRTLLDSVRVQAYLVPANDAHQSEYVGAADRRVEYMTDFTGSNGYAIVTSNDAAIWVDGRYHLQADRQVDADYWKIMKIGRTDVPTRIEWLKGTLQNGSLIGFDDLLMSVQEFETTQAELKPAGLALIPTWTNFVDAVWSNDQPVPNVTPIRPLAFQYSGRRVGDKLRAVAAEIEKSDAEAIILSALDEIAWLFNLRASDIRNTPVFYAYALVTRTNGSWLFLHSSRREEFGTLQSHFTDEEAGEVRLSIYEQVEREMKEVIETISGKIIVPRTTSVALNNIVPTARKVSGSSPIPSMKAEKNAVEAAGMKSAHIRDGAALVRYLHWLELNVGRQNITELSGATQLLTFRAEEDKFQGPSFGSISAVGPNAAVVHYGPTAETDREISTNEIYLIDSGGQYLDGTTDVTRTIHLGEPTNFMKECFTRVLKGYIAIHTSIFPTKTNGAFFDSLARQYLWNVGLDYGHGTGHGIGAYLGVHEYPPSFGQGTSYTISKNMFVSDEPGIYIEDKDFGIRIEDIIQSVEAAGLPFDFDGKGALKFQPITLAPLQQKMIDVTLLSQAEIDWVNAYHQQILTEVGEHLRENGHTRDYDWLLIQTMPISL